MLGQIKELIIASTTAGEDIFEQLEGDVISALEIKAGAAATVTVNGNDFVIDKDEVLAFPYNYMRINSITAVTAGVKLKIRYLAE